MFASQLLEFLGIEICCCAQEDEPPDELKVDGGSLNLLAPVRAFTVGKQDTLDSGPRQYRGSSSSQDQLERGSACSKEHSDVRRLRVPPGCGLALASGSAASDSSPQPSGSPRNAGRTVCLEAYQREQEISKLKEAVREFVADFMVGVDMDVVREVDSALEGDVGVDRDVCCFCSLDLECKQFRLQSDTGECFVNLTDIREVFQGHDPPEAQILFSGLDERCATLVLSGDRLLAFRFDDIRSRSHFATCMKMLCVAYGLGGTTLNSSDRHAQLKYTGIGHQPCVTALV